MEFTTTNYKITTTPKKEYEIAVGDKECPEDDMKDREKKKVVRERRFARDLAEKPIAKDAKLILLEVITVVRIFIFRTA